MVKVIIKATVYNWVYLDRVYLHWTGPIYREWLFRKLIELSWENNRDSVGFLVKLHPKTSP